MLRLTVNETTTSLRRIPFIAELPANRNEIQRINLNDIATGDSFTLTYNGQTTSAINFSADMSADIDTALEGLSNIDASAITVTKGTGHIYDVTFGGNLASTDIPLMTITPTGFTPTGITEVQHGGIAGAPALRVTFAAADISVSKNGATPVNSAGTVSEIGNGRYYYEATAGEVDTLGFLSLAIVRSDLAVSYPTVAIVPASSALGAPVIRSGTAQAGASGTITLDSGASSTSNYYVPCLVYTRAGTGAGQARLAYAYNGTTKVLSVEPNWVTTPDNTTVFDLLPVNPSFADLSRVNHAVPGTFGEVATLTEIANEVESRILTDSTPFAGATIPAIDAKLPSALVGGRMVSDVTAVAGSSTAATKLKDHTAAVLQVLSTAGSATTSFVLNATTGVDGGAPTSTNDAYNGRVLVITSGALAGQAKAITDYDGTTKTLTLESAFTGAPASGVTGVIV